MNRMLITGLVPFVLAFAACDQQQGTEGTRLPTERPPEEIAAGPEHAVATLVPVGESGVDGVVHFHKNAESIRVTGRITGLTPGKHGFHVHQYGDLRDRESGKSAGGHFAPDDSPHGRPSDTERHVGDLGNVEANDEGVAEFDFTDRHIALGGDYSILGRAVVVHESADQFTQPTGDAGGRVAFGVIGIAEPGTGMDSGGQEGQNDQEGQNGDRAGNESGR